MTTRAAVWTKEDVTSCDFGIAPPAPILLHWCLVGEHPVALCGALLHEPLGNRYPAGTDICTDCQRIASRLLREGKAHK